MVVNRAKCASIYPNMHKALTFGIVGEKFRLLGAIASIRDIRPNNEVYFLSISLANVRNDSSWHWRSPGYGHRADAPWERDNFNLLAFSRLDQYLGLC